MVIAELKKNYKIAYKWFTEYRDMTDMAAVCISVIAWMKINT